MTKLTSSPEPTRLDEIRAKYQHLGLALYAFDPKGPVTLEVLTPTGDIFSFSGATEAEVLLRAFAPEDEEPKKPEPSVFD